MPGPGLTGGLLMSFFPKASAILLVPVTTPPAMVGGSLLVLARDTLPPVLGRMAITSTDVSGRKSSLMWNLTMLIWIGGRLWVRDSRLSSAENVYKALLV